MSQPDELLVEYHGSTAWVMLNRPDVRNALSKDLNLQMQDVTAALEVREDIRAIVITGAGDKAFCAGADLKERRGVSAAETEPYINAIAAAIEKSLEPEERSFPWVQPQTTQELLDRIASVSFVAALDPPARDALLEQVLAEVAELPQPFEFHYRTDVYVLPRR